MHPREKFEIPGSRTKNKNLTSILVQERINFSMELEACRWEQLTYA